MSFSNNFPTTNPSLLLDFANTKQLDSRITFTRASTGTFYDGRTVAKAEENLLLQSQDFTSGWTAENQTVSANTGDTTAPDGTSTAEKVTLSAGTNRRLVYRTAVGATTTGLQYVESVFVKAGTHNFVQLTVQNQTSDFANFDLSSGTVGTTGGTVTATITSVGNSWYRISMLYTAGGTNRDFVVAAVSSSSAVRGESFTAVGTETYYLWGAQLEQRSTVTAYTATTTAPITNYIPALQTAAAGVPRFEHNPTTGESLGLEIEEQRTNLVTYSEQFNNAVYTKAQSAVDTNSAIAPDGTLTAEKWYATTSGSDSNTRLLQTVTVSNATVYTASIYVKSAGRRWVMFSAPDASNSGHKCWFDLQNGVVGTKGANATSSSITSVGNGWYRITTTSTSTSTINYIFISATDADNNSTVTSDSFSGIYIWGAQLEAGAFATSYIQTVASQVTRSADSASMTGTNFSSWYRADEGTVYADFVSAGYTANQMIFSLTDGTLNNPVQAYFDTSTQIQLNAWGNGIVFKAAAQNTAYKYAVGLSLNNLGVSINSDAITTDTSVGPARPFSQLNIGNRNGSLIFNGTIKKLAFYPLRVTNAQLQGITTV